MELQKPNSVILSTYPIPYADIISLFNFPKYNQ